MFQIYPCYGTKVLQNVVDVSTLQLLPSSQDKMRVVPKTQQVKPGFLGIFEVFVAQGSTDIEQETLLLSIIDFTAPEGSLTQMTEEKWDKDANVEDKYMELV